MPNINAVLNEQIRRLARREIKANTKAIKKAASHYRRDIASLKRQVSQLAKQVSQMRKLIPQQTAIPAADVPQNARLRVDGLKTHRAKLGLSAKEYGQLLGVSSLTVYNWENGKSKPRRSQLPRIVAIRGIGKREAMVRLGLGAKADQSPDAGKTGQKKRSAFSQTAEQMLLGLLKGRRGLTTSQVNEAWKKEGRGGTANVLLGKLVEVGKLTRTKVKSGRGSTYLAR